MAASTLSAANAVVAAGLSASKVEIGNPTTRASRVFAAPKNSSRSVKSVAVRAQSESQEVSADAVSRRSAISALATAIAVGAASLSGPAFAERIKLEGPPPLFGGLPGTTNADEARDLDKPLKDRFFLQQLPPAETVARVKSSAEDIISVKPLIDRKAWVYVQNELRSQATYLRFDLAILAAAKPKGERKALEAEHKKLFEAIEKLDYACRAKSLDAALKSYGEAVPLLQSVVAKLG